MEAESRTTKAASVDNMESRSDPPRARACSQCAKQKMKCTWPVVDPRSASKVCTRCARMKLACDVPALQPRKKRGKSTKASQIERKLDGIVSLLKSNSAQPQTQQQTPTQTQPRLSSRSHLAEASPPTPENSVVFLPSAANPPPGCEPFLIIDGASDKSSVLTPTGYHLITGFSLTPGQAEAYLIVYRKEYAPAFPFVLLDEDVTAASLYSRSTTLFWSVMAAVVPQTCLVQLEVKKKIRGLISHHCIVLQERSLELLQSVLLYLVWCEFHFFIDSHATPLIQLGLSLVVDLKLNRDPLKQLYVAKTLIGDSWQAFGHPKDLRTAHTPEEKRALLGYYHIASLVQTLFHRGPRPTWSPYHAQCLESLARARNAESDQLLVALVRLQCTLDKLDRLYSEVESQASQCSSGCMMMLIDSVRTDLQSLLGDIPEYVKNDNTFSSLYHLFLMRTISPILSAVATSPEQNDGPCRESPYLIRLLEASKSFFAILVDVPISSSPFLPSTNLCLLSSALDLASRLLLLPPLPGWDPQIAREEVNLPSIVRCIARRYEEADKLAVESGRKVRVLDAGAGVFVRHSAKLQWLAQWFEHRLREVTGVAEGEEAVDVTMEDWEMMLSDEKLWQEFINSSVTEGMLLDMPDFETAPLGGMS